MAFTPRPAPAPAMLDDKDALALLRSPSLSAYPPQAIVKELLVTARFGVIQRAIALGLVSPYILLTDPGEPPGALVHGAACFDAAVPLLRYLVFEQGVAPNHPDGYGTTPLDIVIETKSKRVALFFLRKVPFLRIHACGPRGLSPLMRAARVGLEEVAA